MDRIREVRDVELALLDQDIYKLEDIGADATVLRTKRQTLRDIPQIFDLTKAATPDDLRALWPVDLPPLKNMV